MTQGDSQKKTLLTLLGIVLIALAVTGYKIHLDPIKKDRIIYELPPKENAHSTTTPLPSQPTRLQLVHIAGAVKTPGVYKLPRNARGIDAIKLAGGLLPNAHLDKVNLAAKIKDGGRVYVPFKKEPKRSKSSSKATKKFTSIQASNSPKSVVNINTATRAQLVLIRGIGPKTADRIIRYRRQHGVFSSIQELKKVKGIGEKSVKKIESFITL